MTYSTKLFFALTIIALGSLSLPLAFGATETDDTSKKVTTGTTTGTTKGDVRADASKSNTVQPTDEEEATGDEPEDEGEEGEDVQD